MTHAIELYGSLLLTILGFILPILTILLSLFPEGSKSLSLKYENERNQSEENISGEMKKRISDKSLDYNSLAITLKALKKKKSQAEVRLGYLKPGGLILKIFIPFFVSYLGVLVSLSVSQSIYILVALLFSFISFVGGLLTLYFSVSVLTEVAELVNENKRNNDGKIIELLSVLAAKNNEDNFYLKEEDFKAVFNEKQLTKDELFSFSVNKKYEIPISIINKSDKMAKNIEIGFILPTDFLIEKSPGLNIFTDESVQIVRFNDEIIQAHENRLHEKMIITFLKTGKFIINIFVKGENVKYYTFPISVTIIE
jgi:hypothetical protein